MPETLLQTYLNKQFIKTTEEGNIANLKKAVDEVYKRLSKKKASVIPFTLVAIDPLVIENDPVVVEVEKIITSKWSAFKNSVTKTKDKPTTYVRAVILEALSKLAKDDEFAAIIWHTSRDVVSFYRLTGENETIANFLLEFGTQIEKTGQSSWSGKSDFQLPSTSIPEVKIESKQISKDFLTGRLKAAAGQQRIENGSVVPNENANRYWPNSNANWATDFGNIAGEAIASSISSVLKQQNNSLMHISDQINNAMKALGPFFKEIGTIFLNKAEISNKRGELLWWKQALYSPSLNKSYRGLKPITTAIAVSADLAYLVAPIYPLSVDFFLKETLKDIHGNKVDDPELLETWLEQVLSELIQTEKDLLKVLTNETEGRKPFGTALANKLLLNSSTDIFTETGIDKRAKISLADLAVWLFHDLQAAKIATTK